MDAAAENALVARLRAGDEESFAELVTGHSGRLLGLAWRLTGNRQDAEDIVQEAFLRIHRHIGTFRGDSSLGTWLHRTVTRLAIDQLRRRKLRDKVFFFRQNEDDVDFLDLVPDPSPSPGQRYQHGEIRRRIGRALQQLSPRQRVIFVLRHYEERPLREIAEALDLAEGTVKAHLHRAVCQMRQELKDLHEESL